MRIQFDDELTVNVKYMYHDSDANSVYIEVVAEDVEKFEDDVRTSAVQVLPRSNNFYLIYYNHHYRVWA